MSGSPHAHDPHAPLPVEIPVTDSLADESLDLKTQIVRFVLTGGLSAVVDFGLYLLLLAVGLPLNLAKAISFIAGTTTAYLINRAGRSRPSRAGLASSPWSSCTRSRSPCRSDSTD